MDEEFLKKTIAMLEAQLQKEKALYAAIANISQAAIDQDNLKSIALLALLQQEQSKEQKQEQPETKQSKEQ